MKTFTFYSLVIAFALTSCSGSSEKKIISIEKKIVYTPTLSVNADRKLEIEVAGMSCEHACGGSIRMALKETNAVDRVSFNFQKDRKMNTAYVTFDKSKITADEIAKIISTVNNNQFTIGKSSTTGIEKTDSNTSNYSPKKEDGQDSKIEVNSSSFEFPNLFEFFSGIIS